MPLPNPSLTRRAVLLAKMQTTQGVDAAPTAAADALMVMDPAYSADLTILTRDYARNDLSPLSRRVGRKLAMMRFTTEMKGNAREQSGLIGDAPRIGRLLRASGFQEVAVTGIGTVGAARQVGTVSGPSVAFTVGGANVGTDYYDYVVTVVLGGASATAKLRVTEINGYDATVLAAEEVTATKISAAGVLTVTQTNPLTPSIAISGTWVVGEQITVRVGGISSTYTIPSGGTATTAIATAVAALVNASHATISAAAVTSSVNVTFTGASNGTVVTTAVTALALGASGATVTPAWTGNLVIGQQWKVSVSPAGIRYKPVSENFEMATLWLYLDGVLHKMVDAQGTFTIQATAGNLATVEWTFTGQYQDAIDTFIPSATYEVPVGHQPPVFELAKLRMDGHYVVVNSFSYNQNNQIVPRPDANSADGYAGSRLVARNPEGGIDPEVRKVNDYDFWKKLRTSGEIQLSMRIGQDPGNTVWVKAPNAAYTGLTYGDRDGIRIYDAGLSFARESGDDEVVFHFA